MNRILGLALCLALCASSLSAQLFTFGQVEPHAVRDLSSDILGNTYVTGQNSLGQAVVTKYSPSNVPLWTWADGAGGTYGTSLTFIKPSPTGDVYAMGYSGNGAVLNGTAFITTGTYDPILIKFNSQGQMQWVKQYSGGGTSFEMLFDIYFHAGGEISVMGQFQGAINVGGGTTLTSGSGSHPFWVRYTPTGAFVGASSDGANGSNWTGKFDAAGNMYFPYFASPLVRFSKYDSTGTLLMQSGFSDCCAEIWGITTDSQDNIIVVGGFDGSINIGGTVYTSSTIYDDIYVIKFSPTGNVLWVKTFGGTGADNAYHVDVNAQDQIILAGNYGAACTFDLLSLPDLGGTDMFVCKLDANGNVMWVTGGGGGSSDLQTALDHNIVTGKTLLAGASGSPQATFGSITFSLASNFWLDILDNACVTKGRLFRDLDGNGVQTVGENGFANRGVALTPGPLYGFSGPGGDYEIYSNIGNYTINLNSVPLYHTIQGSATLSSSFTALGQTDLANDYALVPTPGMNDLKVRLHATNYGARQGRAESYHIDFENVGTTTINNAQVSFKYPAGASFTYANPAATNVFTSNDSVVWNIGTLVPGQTGFIFVVGTIPTNIPIGTMLDLRAHITPLAGDQAPGDNQHYIQHEVVGSFDPNEKRVFPAGDIAPSFVTNGDYLEYTIHFQNTGNDTAYFVRLLDTISNNLDMATFEYLSSSHQNLWSIDHNRQLKIDFDQIMLPDSFVNEIESHGYFKYRAKPISSLAVGQSIENRANIYFDFNAPIVTNTTVTTVVVPIAVTDLQGSKAVIEVFPNPAKDVMHLRLPDLQNKKALQVSILDLQGRIIATSAEFLNEIDLSVTNLANGMYLCRITDRSGKVLGTARFVKD